MVYTYTPSYYSSLQDSITSICKNILPFSFKKRRIPAIAAAEQQLSKQQSDNLKWQQDSFHQILNLMGLCKEGILAETEVSAFRTHLLETLIASSVDYEPTVILRDKLIFLQELLYAKCITEDEYHSSKRPLLQRLAVQGAEIESSDVTLGAKKETSNEEEWSVIDLKEEKGLTPNKKSKENSKVKQMKGSVLSFVTPNKNAKLSPLKFPRSELGLSTENPFWNVQCDEHKESESKSILMKESLPCLVEGGKGKKKPFRILFQSGDEGIFSSEKENVKSAKKSWGFDGLKKWKKNDLEHETAPLSSFCEKSDGGNYIGPPCGKPLVENPFGEGSDTKLMKRRLNTSGAPNDYFVDKVLGENVKKELKRIQTELDTRNGTIHLSDHQIEAISTRLPVDKEDLKRFFPKSWCDRYGDIVLDVVRKEFQDHVAETGNSQGTTLEKHSSQKWATFDDDENSHPNLFASQDRNSYSYMKQSSFSSSKNARTSFNSSIDKGFKYNPFFDM